MAFVTPTNVATGDVLTASRYNADVVANVLAGGPIYATEAARDAAITSPFEGQRAYITGSTETNAVGASSAFIPTGIQTIHNGTGWVTVTEVGAMSQPTSQALTTSYVNLTSVGSLTQCILRTGTTALVSLSGRNTATANYYSLNVATATAAATDKGEIIQNGASITAGKTFVFAGLTAGVNTFTLQGKASVAGGAFDYLGLTVKGIA